jgi:hypothetical protein
MKIEDVRTYKIQFHGQVEEEDINTTSPVRLTIEHIDETSTFATLRADQSGMIGLIRHLHGLGLVLLSISCGIENLPDDCSRLSIDKPNVERKKS